MFSWFKKKPATKNQDVTATDMAVDDSQKDHASERASAHKRQGNELLAQGKLAEAAVCYEAAIAENAEDAGAYINLAFVRREQGHLVDAESSLKRALAIDPNDFDANFLLGGVARALGHYDDAVKYLEVAMQLQPLAAQLYLELCQTLFSKGQVEQAKECLRRGIVLIKSKNEQAQLQFYLGNLYLNEERFKDAADCYRAVLDLEVSFPELHNNWGLALQGLGKLNDAEAEFNKALSLRHEYVDAMCHLARIDLVRHQYTAGLSKYERALQWAPEHGDVLCGIGNALSSLKRYRDAITYYERAINQQKNPVQALNNRGIAFEKLRLFDDALSSYNQALEIDPNFVDAWLNRGNALGYLDENHQAIESYQRAFQLDPQNVSAICNCGVINIRENRYDEALACFAKAVEIDPQWADAHYSESLCRLVLGDFENGWKKHEWRWQTEHFVPDRTKYPQPVWLGKESIAGKTILLYSEQGYGDTIQFLRYVKLIAETGAKVLLKVQPDLQSLIRRDSTDFSLVQDELAQTDFDFQCPLLSLPLALGTKLDTIPPIAAYLRPDPARQALWQTNLEGRDRPRVGLVWSGNPNHSNDRNRSISLSELSHILAQDVSFVSLQKDVRESDRDSLMSFKNVAHFGASLTDFAETAALLEHMDLVISVDTSVAHLAASMGKPVWLLVPFRPDWRWLLGRTDSPWYPTMRLFRQEKIGDWSPVMALVAGELKKWSMLRKDGET